MPLSFVQEGGRDPGRPPPHKRDLGVKSILPLLLLLALSVPVSGTARAADSGGSRDFDARIEHNRGFTVAAPSAFSAQASPGTALTRDPTTGATRSVVNRTGYLTGPSAVSQAPSAAALAYLNARLPLLGLSKADLLDYEIRDVVSSQVTGATHIYLRQRYRGIPVYGAQLQVHVSRDGRILGVNSTFLPNIAQAELGSGSAPLLDADLSAAAAALSLEIESPSSPSISQQGSGPARETRLVWEEVSSEPITAQLMWLPIRGGDLRLVWNLQLQPRGDTSLFDFTIDASSGQVWTRFDWASGTQYRVYPRPVESPNHTTPAPPLDGRVVVLNPDDPTASPAGWHAAGATSMTGNNVHAYDDIDGNNLPPGSEPDCGAGLVCDFPLDFAAHPNSSVAAAVANLFYWNNLVHDIQYQYGFDEAAGNFQTDNFGRGGIGSDSVQAEAQDGGGNCNANFLTPPDGSRPRMQMFTCASVTPPADGDFDNGIIVHEYGHGISKRQVGGPATISCLNNPQQAGEGWSDWFALVYTARPEDLATDPRTVGTYLFGQPATGPGLRTQPYSTDPAVNDFTYASINGQAVPHGVGSVWAQVLWEAYWALIDVHGFDPDLHNPAPGWAGNQRALLYVNEGLKNTICSPTFVNNRDGILQAAIDNFGGEDTCTLWQVFADFGLGTDAISGGSNSTAPTNGFSLPPECQVPGNAPAEITISAPSDGASFPSGTLIDFAGSASDPEDGDLTTSLVWSSNISGVIGTGGAFQAPLPMGTHSIAASVSDSAGVSVSSSITVISEVNAPPIVTIISPEERDKFEDSIPVFSGTAIDPEDGDISANLIWTSDLDGEIGQGATFEGSLSEGRHMISALVTDSGGQTGVATLERIDCKANFVDNCPDHPNPGQEDADADLVGDACDVCPSVFDPDQAVSPGIPPIGAACLCGDGSGWVNILDAQTAGRVAVGTLPPNALPLALADVDRSGSINIVDAQYMGKAAVGSLALCDLHCAAAPNPSDADFVHLRAACQ